MLSDLTATYKKHKAKSIIESNWNVFLDSISKGAENKIDQKILLVETFLKHYGFDLIIHLPYGYSFTTFRGLLPHLELIYHANVIAELSSNKSNVYLKCHIQGMDIQDKEDIKFKWYRHFYNGQSFRNYYGETFKLGQCTTIYNVNEKDKNDLTKGIVGYEFKVNIPSGLKYSTLKGEEKELCNNIHKCLITNNKGVASVKFITNPLSDSERFKPIKLKSPYELYVGMCYDYEPLVGNFKYSPHMLITGKSQTGKTKSIITSLTNLCYQYEPNKVQLFCSMISSKQDLRIFKGVSNLQYYADDIDKTLRLLKYLKKEMNRRNKMFAESEKFVSSMYEWNKIHKDKQLPILIACFDEMTLYMPQDVEKKDKNLKSLYLQKLQCLDLFRTIIVEAASSGINIVFLLQRPDKESFPPMVKAQVGLKVGFYQPNTASSLVAMDSDSCANLEMKREAVVSYEKGETLMRTLYIDNDMVFDLLKHKISKDNKMIDLDKNGNKVNEEPPKTEEKEVKTYENTEILDKKEPKISKNEQKTGEKPQKVWNKEQKCFESTKNNSNWHKYIVRKGLA